jgi:hypothetical protein
MEEFFNSSISICTRKLNRFNKSSIQPLLHLCVSQHRRCELFHKVKVMFRALKKGLKNISSRVKRLQ